MRRRLARFVGMRRGFQAVFIRFGKAILPNGFVKRYMFLVNVRDMQGRHVTLHMWMPMRAEDYVWAQLHEGDVISFSAEVETYFKGPPKHRRMDYGLCKPRDVERIEIEQSEEAIDATHMYDL